MWLDDDIGCWTISSDPLSGYFCWSSSARARKTGERLLFQDRENIQLQSSSLISFLSHIPEGQDSWKRNFTTREPLVECWFVYLHVHRQGSHPRSLCHSSFLKKIIWSWISIHFRQSFKVKQEPRKYEILALKHRDIESSDILCITSASVLEVIMETKLLS